MTVLASSGAALRVLVADDDPLNLRICARLLKELGHTGALVTDGAKAMKILDQQTFDVLLLDVNMPELNGFETLKALRSLEQRTGRKRLPVLMVSGHAGEETHQHFKQAGADGFIVKPLGLEALRQEIRRVTGR